jgi:tetratricopeptide (TPR) repeat protein
MRRYTRALFICIALLTLLIPGVFALDTLDIPEGDNFKAIALYNEASDYAYAGDFETALEKVNEALAIIPNFTVALITKGAILSELEQYGEALLVLQVAQELNPEDPYLLANVASIFLLLGEYESALEIIDTALSYSPDMVEAWITKGAVHGALGEYEQEIEASEEALRLDPDNKLAISNINYALEQIKKSLDGEDPIEALLE